MLFKSVCLCMIPVSALLYIGIARAEDIDRVVAYVDNNAITYSELRAEFNKNKGLRITEADTLNSMVNRMLLLKEARAMRLEASGYEELLKEYIEIKIRSVILIKEETVENFYSQNKNNFQNKSLSEVRDDIEMYLFEAETNRLLNQHISNLRKIYDVRIQFIE